MTLPPGPWTVIAADPPWLYQKDPGGKGDGTGPRVTAETKYPTMTNEEIAALDVAAVAADDAHLFMWVTNPGMFGGRFSDLTPAGIAEAWGFEYRTMLTWVKTVSGARIDRGGMGWYFRGATEHVLYATRGRASIPSVLREPNVFLAAKGKHSAKPPAFYAMVDRVIPEGARLEMFARRPRPGWTVWGNEADGSRVIATPAEDRPTEALF